MYKMLLHAPLTPTALLSLSLSLHNCQEALPFCRSSTLGPELPSVDDDISLQLDNDQQVRETCEVIYLVGRCSW